MEIWSAAIIAAGGFLAAALWPWWTALLRQRRFRRLICRELQEASPRDPDKGENEPPWWQALGKRFIHEEIFARERISENRDFILSLDPTLTYHVSQLWIALERHDHTQWLYHLEQLSLLPDLRCGQLEEVVRRWRDVLAAEAPEEVAGLLRRPRSMNLGAGHAARLFDERRAAYAQLVELTKPSPDGVPESSRAFTDWFYSGGNGLLLSGDAFNAFLAAREALSDEASSEEKIKRMMSALRTELKIDLGVRHPDERQVELPRSAERYGY